RLRSRVVGSAHLVIMRNIRYGWDRGAFGRLRLRAHDKSGRAEEQRPLVRPSHRIFLPWGTSQSQFAKSWLVFRARGAELPVDVSVGIVDFVIVNAGMAVRHQPVAINLPVLVTVGAIPLTCSGLGFVAVPNSNPVISEGPEFLDEPVVQLAGPFLL